MKTARPGFSGWKEDDIGPCSIGKTELSPAAAAASVQPGKVRLRGGQTPRIVQTKPTCPKCFNISGRYEAAALTFPFFCRQS